MVNTRSRNKKQLPVRGKQQAVIKKKVNNSENISSESCDINNCRKSTLESDIEKNCVLCDSDFDTNFESLGCFLCNRWTHITCVNISSDFLNSIDKFGNSFQFFCTHCSSKNSFSSTSVSNLETDISNITKKIEELQSTLHEIKSIPTPQNNLLSYSQVLKQKLKSTKLTSDTKNTNTLPNNNSSSNDNNFNNKNNLEKNVVFIRNLPSDTFENPIHFKMHLSQLFPTLKVSHLYKKVNNVIVVFLRSHSDVQLILNNWSTSSLKDADIISGEQLSAQNSTTFDVILKGVPYDILDSTIINTLIVDYPSLISAKRFIKNG